MPQGAHLVGGVARPDTETVIRDVMAHLKGHLPRVTDGETGERYNWIGFQIERLSAVDGVEMGEPRKNPGYPPLPQLRLAKPARELRIDPRQLGYSAAAIESYGIFRQAREEGTIPASTRFQVSLPTPLAVVNAWFVLEQQDEFLPVYAEALFGELDRIAAKIPHQDLAIQWDVAVEIAILENAFMATERQHDFEQIVRWLVECAERVPADVPLGYHLCYGDYGHEHFTQPRDLGLCVRLTNRLVEEVGRPIGWFHMPCPVDRTDDAYFQPLSGLRLAPETELYLGVVHIAGEERSRQLAEAAERNLPAGRRFGVATECGMARTPADQIDELLRIHAAVSTPLSAA